MYENSQHKKYEVRHFPQQNVICMDRPLTRDLLRTLLDTVFLAPFTGYLQFSGDDGAFLFVFFFNGSPYAAGRYADSKPGCYSIHEIARELVKNSSDTVRVTLCETDPVLLKSMLLFLQEEPSIKAPTTLIDFKYIVDRIEAAGAHAMIALCRHGMLNFYFFKDGSGALTHYSDLSYIRNEGMTIDEEMFDYAFQPGGKVQAFVFRDMETPMAEGAGGLDKESLYALLTIGYIDGRRGGSPSAADGSKLEDDDGVFTISAAMEHIETQVKARWQKVRPPGIVVCVESGPQQGECFAVTLPCTIGRKNCDLILNDRYVSRRHAELRTGEGGLVIEDLMSTNGTRVNGEKVRVRALMPDDSIAIGPTILRIAHDFQASNQE